MSSNRIASDWTAGLPKDVADKVSKQAEYMAIKTREMTGADPCNLSDRRVVRESTNANEGNRGIGAYRTAPQKK
jgi:hypothetical protein